MGLGIADSRRQSYVDRVLYRQDENTPAWDGTFQGQQAPEGVYLYRLVFRGGQGDHFLEEEEHGTLVLMR